MIKTTEFKTCALYTNGSYIEICCRLRGCEKPGVYQAFPGFGSTLECCEHVDPAEAKRLITMGKLWAVV